MGQFLGQLYPRFRSANRIVTVTSHGLTLYQLSPEISRPNDNIFLDANFSAKWGELVYIRKSGSIGFDGIQSLQDLRDNWNRLLDAAGLAPEERKEAVALFYLRVETLPGTEVG